MYSSGCTTIFDHFILFPWQANAEAYLCTCVCEQFCTLLPRLCLGRSLRKRCQRTPAPQRQAKLLIDFFIACEKKIQQQGFLDTDFDIRSAQFDPGILDLDFFLSISDFPMSFRNTPNPQGHFSEADWKWTDPKARSH